MHQLNNKGQSIIAFALLLPLILLVVAYIYDISNMNYEKNRINGIAEMIKDTNSEDVCDLVYKNDKNIECTIDSEKITLKKEIKSVLSKILGNKTYQISITIKS